MYLVAIAWVYVVLMMAVAEAISTQGTVLGGVITFVLYGVLPLSIVLYVMGSPLRRRARLAAEQNEEAAASGAVSAASPASADSPGVAGTGQGVPGAGDVSAPAPDGRSLPSGGQPTGLLSAERKET